MFKIPDFFKGGSTKLREKLNAWMRFFISERRFADNVTIRETSSAHGKMLTAIALAATANPIKQLEVIGGGNYTATVAAGFVNGLAVNIVSPSKIGTQVTVSNGDYVYISITMHYGSEDNSWSDDSIAVLAGSSIPAADDTSICIALAQVAVSTNGTVTLPSGGGGGSKWHQRCGTGTVYGDNVWLQSVS
jgi:hypothetical protein